MVVTQNLVILPVNGLRQKPYKQVNTSQNVWAWWRMHGEGFSFK